MDREYILLVEDDADQVELAMRALKRRHPTATVVVKEDGEQAAAFLATSGPGGPPTVVLLDLGLPIMNGFEVLSRIRSNLKTQYVPVVILSSSDEQRDLMESYRRGANSYIRKPVDFNSFSDTIERTVQYWLQINRNSPTPTSIGTGESH
ncbi:MAG TPA: response regulator [Symbiobacteriaceae bacterium]|jgi:two-component system response regulator